MRNRWDRTILVAYLFPFLWLSIGTIKLIRKKGKAKDNEAEKIKIKTEKWKLEAENWNVKILEMKEGELIHALK